MSINNPGEKTDFLSPSLSKSYWVRAGTSSPSLLPGRIVSGLDLCRSWAVCSHSLYAFIRARALLCLRDIFFSWSDPSPLSLTVCCLLFWIDLWALRARVWYRPLGLGCFKVSLFEHCPVVSSKKKLPEWGLSDALNYGYSSMSLGVICCWSFDRVILEPQGLVLIVNVGSRFHLRD